MYVIGLTGNIACGKSTVAAMLAALGACVIDADRLAHEVMRAGSPVHGEIVARFGRAILRDDGEIDRPALGAIVFSDPAALADLERLVHPAVVAESWRRLTACERAVAVVEAIKLLEAEMHSRCDAVWVVTCAREQQLARLVQTRQLTAEQAALRIDAQPSQSHKVALADRVIDNGGTRDETWRQVLEGWNAIPGVAPVPLTRRWGAFRDREG
jgi:dephospho-CoA kinase